MIGVVIRVPDAPGAASLTMLRRARAGCLHDIQAKSDQAERRLAEGRARWVPLSRASPPEQRSEHTA